jgi:hypothetical protein
MFVPEEYIPIERVETKNFIIRKLEARDVYIDYVAYMSSIEAIKKQRGGTWPQPDTTIEDNLIDLGWHQREFELKTSFAFIVTNLEGNASLGCVYFYPVGHPMNSASTNVPQATDVVINMWTTQAALDSGLYDELYRFVEDWVREKWPFQQPYYSNLLKPNN